MRRRKKRLIWLAIFGVPTVAACLYFLVPARTQVKQPIGEVREALKELYPKHDFKTVTDNGTYIHGNTNEIQKHPAYEGWGEPGWDLDVEYRDGGTGAFEIEIANYAKLQSRRTVIRAVATSQDSTRISVRTEQHWGFVNSDFRNPTFARSRLREIRSFLSQGGP